MKFLLFCCWIWSELYSIMWNNAFSYCKFLNGSYSIYIILNLNWIRLTDRPVAEIPNASIPYPTWHHFVTEMCTCLLHIMVHCVIVVWHIMWYMMQVFYWRWCQRLRVKSSSYASGITNLPVKLPFIWVSPHLIWKMLQWESLANISTTGLDMSMWVFLFKPKMNILRNHNHRYIILIMWRTICVCTNWIPNAVCETKI